MEYKFTYKFVKSAPRKVRLVADLVRNMKPNEAIDQLKFLQKNAVKPVQELIKSALAALNERNIDSEKIIIKSLQVNNGPMLKRRRFRSRGRADIIRKRMSHITLVLAEQAKSKIKDKKIKTQTKDTKTIKSKNK